MIKSPIAFLIKDTQFGSLFDQFIFGINSKFLHVGIVIY